MAWISVFGANFQIISNKLIHKWFQWSEETIFTQICKNFFVNNNQIVVSIETDFLGVDCNCIASHVMDVVCLGISCETSISIIYKTFKDNANSRECEMWWE
jgi:hypothetical protein